MSLILLLFFVPVPDAIDNLLSGLIGVILAKWQTIVDYHFGSSSGSQRKSDIINEMTGTAAGSDGKSKTSTQATTHTEKTTTVTSETPPEEEKP